MRNSFKKKVNKIDSIKMYSFKSANELFLFIKLL